MSAQIVRLPTAAPLKVKQGGLRATRAARNDCLRFPRERVRWPTTAMQEANERIARRMLTADKATTMQIAMAVFSVLDETQRLRVRGRLVALTALSRAGAESALAWVHYEDASKDRKTAIDWAGERLMERGEL